MLPLLQPVGEIAPDQPAQLADILAEVFGHLAAQLGRDGRPLAGRLRIGLLEAAPQRTDKVAQPGIPAFGEQAGQAGDRGRREAAVRADRGVWWPISPRSSPSTVMTWSDVSAVASAVAVGSMAVVVAVALVLPLVLGLLDRRP